MMCVIKIIQIICLLLLCTNIAAQKFLSRNGTQLRLNGEKVFLSGMNQAWVHYAEDFGNGGYEKSKATLYQTLDTIHRSGGNSIRVWLHVSGQSTPQFDRHGYVTGPGQSLIADLRDFLKQAQRKNVLVNICLWNGALRPDSRLENLIQDDGKLTSYINNALVPMVTALSDLRSMGSWEIINEAAGSTMFAVPNHEPCYDTTDVIRWMFANWTGATLPWIRILRFIARQVSAIHRADKKAMVTTGIWEFKLIALGLYKTNYFSDRCLTLANDGIKTGLDFYQIHTYDLPSHNFSTYAPFTVNASFYHPTKPVVIGEFSAKRGGGLTSPVEFTWAYTHGYSGAWSWSAIGGDGSADSVPVQVSGMETLRGRDNQTLGGRVNIDLNYGAYGVNCDSNDSQCDNLATFLNAVYLIYSFTVINLMLGVQWVYRYFSSL